MNSVQTLRQAPLYEEIAPYLPTLHNLLYLNVRNDGNGGKLLQSLMEQQYEHIVSSLFHYVDGSGPRLSIALQRCTRLTALMIAAPCADPFAELDHSPLPLVALSVGTFTKIAAPLDWTAQVLRNAMQRSPRLTSISFEVPTPTSSEREKTLATVRMLLEEAERRALETVMISAEDTNALKPLVRACQWVTVRFVQY